jgi:hypothetical protein
MKWGSGFWEETEERIKELTTKLENDLKAELGGKIPGFNCNVSDYEKITKEQKSEVVYRAQHVVNSIQAKQLTGIIELTHEVLDDPQQTYILAVDKLDEDWGLRIASRGPLTAPEFGLANPSSKFRNARS